MSLVFRIDDISINTSEDRLRNQISGLLQRFESSSMLLGISPLVFDMNDENGVARERIFPKIYNAYSDFRLYLKTTKLGIPDYVWELGQNSKINLASHGLVHVDHRLLDRGAQELSILTSCALSNSQTFIPPFNKWNEHTESICRENDIDLIKFEDGWRHLGYNQIDEKLANKYYYHTHDFSDEKFQEILNNDK